MQTTINPDIYTFFSVSFELINSGAETANQIRVALPLAPNGSVLKGGDEFELTGGSYNAGSNEWLIEDLEPGQQATFTFNYFNLSESAKIFYAEVVAQTPLDEDSSPGNGTPPTPNEDDEAVVQVNGGNDPCDNDITPPVLSACPDDITVFTTIATGSATWTPPTATDNCSDVTLTSNFEPGYSGFAVGTTPVIYTATDESGNSSTCSFTVTVVLSSDCIITAEASNVQCQDNNTPNDPSDDTFTFTFVVDGENAGSEWTVGVANPPPGVVGTGAYGVPVTQGPFPINDGAVTIAVRPNDIIPNGPCTASVTVQPPAPCSGNPELPDLNLAQLSGLPAFAKQGEVVNFTFDLINSGDAIASGDYAISAILSTDSNVGNADDVEVGVINTGNTPVGTISDVQGAITIPANQPPGGYFLILIADANNDITESNESNNFLSGNIAIMEGDPGEGVDLMLAASASNNTPAQWTFFSVEFQVVNTGSENATGVKVGIPTPDGIKLKGGDEFDASQGSYTAYGNQVWNVGSLAAGTSATITLNYFNLSSGAVTVFGQVTDQDQTDTDSTPDNNNGTVPNEDDEAAITLNGNVAPRQALLSEDLKSSTRNFTVLKTYPNLTANDVNVVLTSKMETTMTMKILNSNGQQVAQQNISVIKGENKILIQTGAFQSGMYHVMLQPEKGRPVMTRFVKVGL